MEKPIMLFEIGLLEDAYFAYILKGTATCEIGARTRAAENLEKAGLAVAHRKELMLTDEGLAFAEKILRDKSYLHIRRAA